MPGFIRGMVKINSNVENLIFVSDLQRFKLEEFKIP